MTIYVAVIADVIASRDLPAARRAHLQRDLRQALPEFNRRWERDLAARFAITLGDELQCLLRHPRAVWDVAHAIRRSFASVDWVVACGRGTLATPIPPGATAPELDGPCFHAARAAVEQGKTDRQVLVFAGFTNPALDGLARYYSALYWSWTARQRRAVAEWRWSPPSPSPTARRARENPSALSHLRRRVAWPLVEGGDRIFRALLEDA
jgi:hypothetical protein